MHAAGGVGIGVGVLLILLSAALPVLGAGLRTIRSAHEFARNTIRFRAKRVALNLLKARLRTEETEPSVVFRELWGCEQILEAEQREWLRLMIEAEWFG